jgi:Bacterial Ig-like domain (group 3)/Autotransporter beta-domain
VCTVAGGTVTIVAAGTCTIAAAQVGDANYNPAPSVSLSFAVNRSISTTTLASSLNPSIFGQSVTLTATVSSADLTGSVTFMDGGTTLGTGTVTNGVATLTTSTLAAGTRVITAAYSGNANTAGSTSSALRQSVTATGTIVLKVRSGADDGAFTFASATSNLNHGFSTLAGGWQSAPLQVAPGTYTVTMGLPSGFGLTGITCSDSDSRGNLSQLAATIVIAPAEAVTCTFSVVNARKKTVEVISRFMKARNDLLLSNGPDSNRQIDRLIEASGRPATAAVDLGNSGAIASASLAPSRLGALSEGGFNPALSAPGLAAAQRGSIGGPRVLEERVVGQEPAALAPFRVMGETEGAARFSFSSSLSQVARATETSAARKARDVEEQNVNGATGAVGGGRSPDVKAAFSPLDIWTEVHYLSFADARNNADSGGHFGVTYFGADYVVKPWLLVGLLAQYDTMHQSSNTQAFDIKGSGWMAGPYATVRLSETLFLQGRLAGGRSTNEVSPFLTYTDNFSTKRWLASTALVGRWSFGNWQLQPSVALAYMQDVSEAYVDRLGTSIPGLKVSLGQLKAGPHVSYRHTFADGTTLEPRVGVELLWNFAGSDRVADFGGTLSGPDGVRGRVELGLKTRLPSGLGFDISGSYDGIGSDSYLARGAKATVRVPLN